MVGDDWTTYVVAPNYLRVAPLLTFPLGRVPGYIAPSGTTLAMTDSLPVLTPVYRLLLAIFPNSSIQLVGLILLVAFVLTFTMVARFADLVETNLRPLSRELITLALATVLTVAPFWNLQYVHPALMQQWVIVWALITAFQRCPSFLGGRFRQSNKPRKGLGPIIAAALIQPYLIPMVAIPALAPDLVRARSNPRFVMGKIALAVGSVAIISFLLGYIGDGSRLGSTGFGNYAADLTSVVDPNSQSRFLTDIHGTADSIGGYGYVGLGGLALLFLACRTAVVDLLRRMAGPENQRVPSARWPLAALRFGVTGLFVFALLPTVRVAGRPMVDLSAVFNRFASLTAVFRVNGRFVWVLLWFGLLIGVARTMLISKKWLAISAALSIALCQLVEVRPWKPLVRPQSAIEYYSAVDILSAYSRVGATSIQFQPPVVIPGCYPEDFGRFDEIGDALLAASKVGMPVNSGYTARLAPRFVELNCHRDAVSFQEAVLDYRVVYIVPSTIPVRRGLGCNQLTTKLLACRSLTP